MRRREVLPAISDWKKNFRFWSGSTRSTAPSAPTADVTPTPTVPPRAQVLGCIAGDSGHTETDRDKREIRMGALICVFVLIAFAVLLRLALTPKARRARREREEREARERAEAAAAKEKEIRRSWRTGMFAVQPDGTQIVVMVMHPEDESFGDFGAGLVDERGLNCTVCVPNSLPEPDASQAILHGTRVRVRRVQGGGGERGYRRGYRRGGGVRGDTRRSGQSPPRRRPRRRRRRRLRRSPRTWWWR